MASERAPAHEVDRAQPRAARASQDRRAFDAQDTVWSWTRAGAELVARRLSDENATFVTREPRRSRALDERAFRRQVSWAWPVPWQDHPYAGVWTGLTFGWPEAPVLQSGMPDLGLCWQCDPTGALHRALVEDRALVAAASRWAGRKDRSVDRCWAPPDWLQLLARSPSAIVEGADPAGQFLAWVDRVLTEWEEDGITERLRAHLAATGAEDQGPPASEPQPGPASGEPSTT